MALKILQYLQKIRWNGKFFNHCYKQVRHEIIICHFAISERVVSLYVPRKTEIYGFNLVICCKDNITYSSDTKYIDVLYLFL